MKIEEKEVKLFGNYNPIFKRLRDDNVHATCEIGKYYISFDRKYDSNLAAKSGTIIVRNGAREISIQGEHNATTAFAFLDQSSKSAFFDLLQLIYDRGTITVHTDSSYDYHSKYRQKPMSDAILQFHQACSRI